MKEKINLKTLRVQVLDHESNNFQETMAYFDYKGKTINKPVYIKKHAKVDQQYYIDETKKKLTSENENGKLTKYAKQYLNGGHNRTGIALGVCFAVVAAAGLGVGGYFIGKSLTSGGGGTVKVTFNANPDELHVACFDDDASKTTYTIEVAKGSKFGDIKKMANPIRHEPIEDKSGKLVPSINGKVFDTVKQWNNSDKILVNDSYAINSDLVVDPVYKRDTASIKIFASGNASGYFATGAMGETVQRQFAFNVEKGTTLGDALNIGTAAAPTYIKPILLEHEGDDDYALKCYFDGQKEYYLDGEKAEKDLKTPIEDDMTLEAIYKQLPGGEAKKWMNITLYATDPDVDEKDCNYVGAWENENLQPVTNMTVSIPYEEEEDKWTWAEIKADIKIFDDPTGTYAGFKCWEDEDGATITDSTEFVRDCSIYAYYEPNFTNDTWKAVCNNAELGIDRLHSVYGDNLCGKKRWVNVSGVSNPYEVEVIAESADCMEKYLATPSGTDQKRWLKNPTALTFKFRNSISEDSYGCAFSNDFANSNVSNRLNDFYNKIENDLKNNIKTVCKLMGKGPDTTIDVATCKLFILTAAEVPALYTNGYIGSNLSAYNMVNDSTYTPITYSYLSDSSINLNSWLRGIYYDANTYNGIYVAVGEGSLPTLGREESIATRHQIVPLFAIGQAGIE